MSGSDLVAFWVGIQENATGQKIKSTNLSGKTLFLCEKTDLRLITIIIEMQKKKNTDDPASTLLTFQILLIDWTFSWKSLNDWMILINWLVIKMKQDFITRSCRGWRPEIHLYYKV